MAFLVIIVIVYISVYNARTHKGMNVREFKGLLAHAYLASRLPASDAI